MKRIALALLPVLAFADGSKDNLADNVRPVPPPGVVVPEADAAPLKQGLAELRTAIDAAVKAQAKNPKLADLLPDVEVYHKAVDWALKYNEVHKLTELKSALEIITEGKQRAEQLKNGQHPWTTQKGLVVRGYRSKIDGSVQPYGMVIPETYSGAPSRLDAWCHGRGETLSELGFLDQRRKQTGNIAPANALVLHPYGRYCCANKFAGEIDLIEALDHAKKFYAIDEDRTIIRGFSMGGAAAWQFAVNYSDKWCAANPGAGFAETPEFLNVFQSEDVSKIPVYEKTLWHWYNATDSALNLFNLPTVAYSGEIDRQKQAADIMEKYLRMENIELEHIIGPQTAHKIHPDSLIEIEKRLAAIAAVGRDRTPKEIHFATWLLRYNKMHWITVDELEKHWERTRVHAEITGENEVTLKTQNVTAITIDMAPGHCPFSVREKPSVKIDGATLEVVRPKTDRSWVVHLRRVDGKWQQALSAHEEGKLVKQHGLSGPIDDAFMDSFLFVKPTGAAMNDKVGAWTKAEMERASFEWRRQFRGDAPAKDDKAITDADIAANNLILWGDPQSNAVLAKVIAKLPIKWADGKLEANGKTYDASTHAPVLVYPNPLNPKRYVVINSSFTYREYDYLNNARQVAKLPDWAVVDFTQPKSSRAAGGIPDAGFFDEGWQWKK
ncbi:MAG: prolyl oligopeptidase family serine peptidase [Verrucomicrobiota bacterium]